MVRIEDEKGSNEWDAKSITSNFSGDYEVKGNKKKKIKGISSLATATTKDLSFCSADGQEAIRLISQTKAGIILCNKSLQGLVHPQDDSQIIFIDKPRLVFVEFANKIFEKKKMVGISPKAVISKTATVGSGCYIGDFTTIGENCKIGNDTIIYNNVSLVKDCVIGDRCIIHSGVTLGDDGFAFERNENRLQRFPHFGRVLIGNEVEICANSHIAKGSLSDTIIGDGTKIDAMVHISHNVSIGKNCEVTAGAVIGGSTMIGDSTWIGLNATLKNKIKIGSNVIIASGASVIREVPDEDVVAGVPAKSIKHKITTTADELFLMAGQKTDQKKKIDVID